MVTRHTQGATRALTGSVWAETSTRGLRNLLAREPVKPCFRPIIAVQGVDRTLLSQRYSREERFQVLQYPIDNNTFNTTTTRVVNRLRKSSLFRNSRQTQKLETNVAATCGACYLLSLPAERVADVNRPQSIEHGSNGIGY